MEYLITYDLRDKEKMENGEVLKACKKAGFRNVVPTDKNVLVVLPETTLIVDAGSRKEAVDKFYQQVEMTKSSENLKISVSSIVCIPFDKENDYFDNPSS